MLPEAGGLELPVEGLRGCGRFGKYKQAFHGLVQTVDDGKIGLPVFGLQAVQVVFQDTYHIGRADLPALGGNAGRLYADKDMRVFKQDFWFHGGISFSG